MRTGERLNDAFHLLNDPDFGTDLREGESSRIAGGIYLDACRDHQERRVRRSRQTRRTMMTVLSSLTILALVFTGLAVWRTMDANRQRDEAWSNEADAWMLRAKVAEREGQQYPATMLYAARAIGFDGVGRAEKVGRTFSDQLADWMPFHSFHDPTPRLWTRRQNPTQYEMVRQWIRDRPSYLPVWSVDQPDLKLTAMAISPEGRYLAVGGNSRFGATL